jgi:hypothetical protein
MYKVQNETTTENVSTQAITPGGASVSVNGSNLSPSPFVSISIDQFRSGELVLGGVMNVSLNGTVTGDSFSEVVSAVKNVLAIGKSGDCVNVNINCGGTQLVNGYGTIKTISANEGPDPTWVQVATYNIEIELYVNESDLVVRPNTNASSHVTANEIIKDLSESVSLNLDNDGFETDNMNGSYVGKAHAKYNFSISATGAAVGCSAAGKLVGIEAAEQVLQRRINSISNGNISSGLGNTPNISSQLSTYHSGQKFAHVRSVDVDPVTGTVSASGEVIMRPSGSLFPQVFIDVSVDSRSDSTQVGRVVVISGTIEGLHAHDFSSIISNGTFHGASTDRVGVAINAYNTLKSSFPSIANAYQEAEIEDACSLSDLYNICFSQVDQTECTMREVNSNVTRNFGTGSVSFTTEFSTVQNCTIVGAAKVELECTHTYPTDVFAEFVIPFRSSGPLTQDLGTSTKEVISCTGSAQVENQGCDSRDLSNISSCLEGAVDSKAYGEGADASWYITQRTKTYSNTGVLRITKEWTKRYDCS